MTRAMIFVGVHRSALGKLREAVAHGSVAATLLWAIPVHAADDVTALLVQVKQQLEQSQRQMEQSHRQLEQSQR
jgi:putative Ca2+/H+ antiporter (TMEM165/GDT1 family)